MYCIIVGNLIALIASLSMVYSGFIYNIATPVTWSLILIAELEVVILFTFFFRKLPPLGHQYYFLYMQL